MGRAGPRSAYRRDIVAQLEAIAETLERPPVLAVVGQASAGKSTLINRLLGRDVMPTDVVPMMTFPTLVRFGERDECVVNHRDGRAELVELTTPFEYRRPADFEFARGNQDAVQSIDVLLRCEELKRYRLLDTQGLFQSGCDDGSTEAAIGGAVGVVWCTNVNSPWKDSERSFWERLPPLQGRNTVLVVTRTNDLTPTEQNAVRDRLKRDCHGLFQQIVFGDFYDAGGTHGAAALARVKAALTNQARRARFEQAVRQFSNAVSELGKIDPALRK